MKKTERRRRVEAIADEDGVTPEVVNSAINEVEGLLSMVAGDSEVSDDALPRMTTCPHCGGPVAFAPLSALDIPRVHFTSDTPWGMCRTAWMEHARPYYEQAVKGSRHQIFRTTTYVEFLSKPFGLILECQQCGKGFDPR